MKKKKNTSKPKKITVRFFLQKKVQPHAVLGYPLYIYLTYNRKNMQFKSLYGKYYAEMKDVNKGIMDFEKKRVEKIIRYETSLLSNQDKYEMKGLKDKYKIYATSIHKVMEHFLKPKLKIAIDNNGNDLFRALNLDILGHDNTVLRLYRIAGMISNNFLTNLDKTLFEEIKMYKKFSKLLHATYEFRFSTVIDWLNGSYKKQLNILLSKQIKGNPEMISNINNLISKAVDDKLKEIEKIDQKYIEANKIKKRKKQ